MGCQLVAVVAELGYERFQREHEWHVEQQQRFEHEQLGSPRTVDTFKAYNGTYPSNNNINV